MILCIFMYCVLNIIDVNDLQYLKLSTVKDGSIEWTSNELMFGSWL